MELTEWNSQNGTQRMEFKEWNSKNGIQRMELKQWNSKNGTLIMELNSISIHSIFVSILLCEAPP